MYSKPISSFRVKRINLKLLNLLYSSKFRLVNKVKVIVYQAVLTKVLPLIFLIPAFLIIFPFTRDALSILEPVNAFYGILLIYVGLIYLIEMGFALPEAGKGGAGIFGAVLLFALGIGSLFFASMILVDQYDVVNDQGFANQLLSVLMIIAILMFTVQAREELFHYRRFSMHQALRRLA